MTVINWGNAAGAAAAACQLGLTTQVPATVEVAAPGKVPEPVPGVRFTARPFIRRERELSPTEVAVLEVLRLLKPRNAKDGKPSLAVLSPYAQQVKRLAADLPGAPRALTAHLDQFHAASHEGKFVGTVDSFQGNEADVVVVSLVRNNRGGVVGSALGFLADARRMNVMLSRARWRLIMVGSLRFLQDTVRADQAQSRGEPIKFLPELLAALETAQQQGDMKVVSVSRILA